MLHPNDVRLRCKVLIQYLRFNNNLSVGLTTMHDGRKVVHLFAWYIQYMCTLTQRSVLHSAVKFKMSFG